MIFFQVIHWNYARKCLQKNLSPVKKGRVILATGVCTFLSKLLEIEPHTCTSETFISETCIFRRSTLQKSNRYLNAVEFKYAVSMLCLIQLITGCCQVSGGLLPTLFMCCYHFSCVRYSNPFVTCFVDLVKNCVGFSSGSFTTLSK